MKKVIRAEIRRYSFERDENRLSGLIVLVRIQILLIYLNSISHNYCLLLRLFLILLHRFQANGHHVVCYRG